MIPCKVSSLIRKAIHSVVSRDREKDEGEGEGEGEEESNGGAGIMSGVGVRGDALAVKAGCARHVCNGMEWNGLLLNTSK